MIEVVVGEDSTNTWRLHQNLLSSVSSYFRALASSGFQEGIEKKVTLKEEENAIFALFVQWLYTRVFFTGDIDFSIRAYVLGDRLGAPEFASFALDKIYVDSRWYAFPAHQVIWVTEHTTSGSALRRLVLDSVAYKIVHGSLPTFSTDDWEVLAPVHGDLLQAVFRLTHSNARRRNFMTLAAPPRSTYIDKN